MRFFGIFQSLLSLAPVDVGGIVAGMKHIFGGMSIIGIGLVLGDSIFINKNPTFMGYIFDGLGLFFVGKGIYSLPKDSTTDVTVEQREASKEPPE